MFDNFRPILASFQAVICSHQAVLPSPPEKVKYEYQAYAGQFKKQYQAATILQFEKNAGLYVYGMPILKKDLPQDAVLLKSVMAPSIKKSHDIANLYTFKIRHTLNGKPMQQGVHFDESYSPTCAMDSVKCGLALATSKKYEGCGMVRVTLITPFKQLFDLLIPKKRENLSQSPISSKLGVRENIM